MNDSRRELQDSWKRTEEHLARANALLPAGGDSTLDPGVEWYRHFLGRNELQLAMEALDSVGRRVGAPDQFWVSLADAADEMGLADAAETYRAMAQRA